MTIGRRIRTRHSTLAMTGGEFYDDLCYAGTDDE